MWQLSSSWWRVAATTWWSEKTIRPTDYRKPSTFSRTFGTTGEHLLPEFFVKPGACYLIQFWLVLVINVNVMYLKVGEWKRGRKRWSKKHVAWERVVNTQCHLFTSICTFLFVIFNNNTILHLHLQKCLQKNKKTEQVITKFTSACDSEIHFVYKAPINAGSLIHTQYIHHYMCVWSLNVQEDLSDSTIDMVNWMWMYCLLSWL